MEQIIVSVLCIVIGLIAFYGIVHVERMKRGFDKYIADCRAEQKQRELDTRSKQAEVNRAYADYSAEFKRQALRNRAGLY